MRRTVGTEEWSAIQEGMRAERDFQLAANVRRIICERCRATKYISRDRDGFVCDNCQEGRQ